MDESCTGYDLMIYSNKQVEKPSDKRNSSSDIELIDENHSIIDSKSSLPTRKQRLINYLTTTHTPDKNITSTYKLHNFSTVDLINFVPKIDDYNKPVKVKSQWTRTSQKELALENSTNKNTLPVNNLSKSEKINEILTMDVSPVNGIINQSNELTDDTGKTDKKTDDDSAPVKRKRGRPKKISNNITDNTSVISNISNQDSVKTNSIADMESKNTGEPKVAKRGRGRPRKNELTSTTIQIPPIVSNSTPAKKRIKTRQGSTVLKKRCAIKSNNDEIIDSKSHKLDPGHPEKLSSSKVMKSLTKTLNKNVLSYNKTEVNENSPESGERSFSPIMLFPGDGNDLKCLTLSRFNDKEKSPLFISGGCDTLIDQENTTRINILEGCNNSNVQENTKSINFLEGFDNTNVQKNTSVNFLEECDKSDVQENTTSVNFLEGCDNTNVQENTSVNFLEECDKSDVQENNKSVHFLEGCDNTNVQENTSVNFLEECDKSDVQENTKSINILEGCDNTNVQENTSVNFLEECDKSDVQENTKSINILEGCDNTNVQENTSVNFLEECDKSDVQENNKSVHFLEGCDNTNVQENTSVNFLEECDKSDVQENTKSINILEGCDNTNVPENTSVNFLEECDKSDVQENTKSINILEGCDNTNVPENTSVNVLEECDKSDVQENTTSINYLEGCDNTNVQENTSVNVLEECDKSDVQENTNSINFLEGFDNSNVQKNTSVNVLEECDKSDVQENTNSINFIEGCDQLNVQDKIDCVSDTRIKNNEFLSESEQDVFSELEKVDWNLAPKRIRSNSVNESTKKRNRRNSLDDNFVYYPPKRSKKSMFGDSNVLKSWKSVSYLERGPNIQVERIIRDELVKKFRSKLKRSRSFPNCLFLDTVIWRFLVQECEYDYEPEENYESSSDLDEDSSSDSDRCENSEPIQIYEQPKEKTNHISVNLDNLNMLCSINDVPPFHIPSNISDLENSESDPEDHRSSDTYECHFLENSVSSNTSRLKNSESDQEESESKIRRSKRLNTKFKATDMLEEEYLLSSENSNIDSLLLADEIRRDNEIHLAEARANDPELDKKLKKLNFTLISNNLFRPHRKEMGEYTPAEAQELRRLKPRRSINSDTYKCHCKYTRKDWIEKKPGCATECLNRLLNIECGKACVLKSLCTNKQFQNKQFKRTKVIKTADKGYGVFALEDIPSGTFVDEYVGEVINQSEMIHRMKKILYKNNNYMVQLKHDEIIDATRKGNITRFINHSCDPNCVAEKWNVLGESRMGFFSKQPIQIGEEITFDYSFEIFGDAAQQKCYCGSPKCRGFISKKFRTGDDQSSDSEDNDGHEDDTSIFKPDACLETKQKPIKKISNKDRKRLRQLDQQLTDISKLKNKNRSDLESSTLNLNKLMVHITDSMSRSHILKFIRDNDLNCKRLFMNFNGLNIIHSWMTSNNNKRLKLEIVETLSDLPISNRNTITKSKVLDIVAQWANIPLNIKETIENLEYPISQIKEHEQEIDKLLPDVNNISPLVKAARILWKKWIVLKIVFKIPKLDRPKEVNIPDDVIQPPILFSQPQINSVPYTFGNHTVPTQPSKMSCLQSQGNDQTNSVDSLTKIINHQKINRDKNKTVLEWKKHCDHLPFKTNKVISPAMVNYSINSVLNPKQSSNSTFKSRIAHQDIPTIESSTLTKNEKWSSIIENDSTVYDLPPDSSEKINSSNIESIKVFETEPIVYYPIEEIITTNQTWNLPPPTIIDLCNGSTLNSMLKTVPPCLPNDFISNTSDEASQCSFSDDTTAWCIMRPENVMYDAQHPSIQEQLTFLPSDIRLNKSTKTQLDIPNNNAEKTDFNKKYKVVQPLTEDMREKLLKKCEENVQQLIDKRILNDCKTPRQHFVVQSPIELLQLFFNKKYKVVQPLNEDMREKLFKKCEENMQQLIDKGILNACKTARQNYVDQSPIKILQSFFNKKLVKSTNVTPENNPNQYVLPNLMKRIKVISSGYRKQPSKIIVINNLVKSNSLKSKNDIFRIKDDQKTEITDATSVALMLHNEQLSTVPETLNLNKMFNKKSFKINTKNKFAFKILNSMVKHNTSMPKSFILQFPSDTKIITHNPSNELELHFKLIPSVENILCAKLNRGVGKDIKVYKQKIVMKYDETKAPEPVTLAPALKENIVLPDNSIEIPQVKKQLKRKMPLPPLHNTKNKKIVDLVKKNSKSRNQATIINKTNDNVVFKKPMPPVINKNSSQGINTSVTSQVQEPKISSIALINTNASEFRQKPCTSSQIIPSTAFLDVNDFRLEPSTSSCIKPDIDPSKTNLKELSREPSNQLITNITSLKTNTNEIRQKPLMKCLPFNKVDDILITELEQNAKLLASILGMDSTHVLPSTEANSELIDPIVQNFKNSISQNKSMIRANLVDDPIVRDYIQRTQSKSVDMKRKCKLPESMMSLPVEVLNLIPDNQREIKYVIDFYHAMATVIVKVLDLYVKKSCKQGRIKNDDDFKYLAKKLNSNILFKELQVKKVEDLRISDSVKQKVEQYIKKYMLKYGKLYRRKSTDQ